MPLIVRKNRCTTCIFGPNSPISAERFKQLERSWKEENKIQICHTEQGQDSNAGCFGHFQAARRGEAAYPLIAATAEAFGLDPSILDFETSMQICERLGVLTFKNSENIE